MAVEDIVEVYDVEDQPTMYLEYLSQNPRASTQKPSRPVILSEYATN